MSLKDLSKAIGGAESVTIRGVQVLVHPVGLEHIGQIFEMIDVISKDIFEKPKNKKKVDETEFLISLIAKHHEIAIKLVSICLREKNIEEIKEKIGIDDLFIILSKGFELNEDLIIKKILPQVTLITSRVNDLMETKETTGLRV